MRAKNQDLLNKATAGEWLDEYPYACTREGGVQASAKLVDWKEQVFQGGTLGGFVWWKLGGQSRPFFVLLIP